MSIIDPVPFFIPTRAEQSRNWVGVVPNRPNRPEPSRTEPKGGGGGPEPSRTEPNRAEGGGGGPEPGRTEPNMFGGGPNWRVRFFSAAAASREPGERLKEAGGGGNMKFNKTSRQGLQSTLLRAC